MIKPFPKFGILILNYILQGNPVYYYLLLSLQNQFLSVSFNISLYFQLSKCSSRVYLTTSRLFDHPRLPIDPKVSFSWVLCSNYLSVLTSVRLSICQSLRLSDCSFIVCLVDRLAFVHKSTMVFLRYFCPSVSMSVLLSF